MFTQKFMKSTKAKTSNYLKTCTVYIPLRLFMLQNWECVLAKLINLRRIGGPQFLGVLGSIFTSKFVYYGYLAYF